jgi:hypothetical protein
MSSQEKEKTGAVRVSPLGSPVGTTHLSPLFVIVNLTETGSSFAKEVLSAVSVTEATPVGTAYNDSIVNTDRKRRSSSLIMVKYNNMNWGIVKINE